ncbi:MAG: hypothetical protein E2P02_01555 [Acidobacteria bacterium]|nr:MAG: hypothetical protein E2P02_01555 [Acidobacteriota bacterium]
MLGVRVALGASQSAVLSLIVGQGLRLILMGIGVGVIAAAMLTRFLESLLFEVSAFDPAIYSGLALALGAVGLVASLLSPRASGGAHRPDGRVEERLATIASLAKLDRRGRCKKFVGHRARDNDVLEADHFVGAHPLGRDSDTAVAVPLRPPIFPLGAALELELPAIHQMRLTVDVGPVLIAR